MRQYFSQSRGGFTLVESLVAASIFLLLTSIAVGAFVQALKSQRALVALMSLSSNAGTALEQMARELRTGYGFCEDRVLATSTCFLDSDQIEFVNYAGVSTTFALMSDGGRGYLARNGHPLTSQDIDVTAASFLVSQELFPQFPNIQTESACAPWKITIAFTARPTNTFLSGRSFPLQTTVASRVLPREAPNVRNEILNYCISL